MSILPAMGEIGGKWGREREGGWGTFTVRAACGQKVGLYFADVVASKFMLRAKFYKELFSLSGFLFPFRGILKSEAICKRFIIFVKLWDEEKNLSCFTSTRRKRWNISVIKHSRLNSLAKIFPKLPPKANSMSFVRWTKIFSTQHFLWRLVCTVCDCNHPNPNRKLWL